MVAAKLANISYGGDRTSDEQAANLPLETSQADAAESSLVLNLTLQIASKVLNCMDFAESSASMAECFKTFLPVGNYFRP